MAISLLEIVRRINKLNVLHRIYIHKQASKNSLYFGQLPILEYVKRHDKCTQREVADFLKVSPPSVATSIKRMQKAGLLEKTIDESDLRYNRITITEKGSELSHKCRSDFNKVDEQMFLGFNNQECEQLCGYLERMIANLSTEELENRTFFSLVAEEKKLLEKQSKEVEIDD